VFDWTSYLHLAEELAQRSEEAAHRSAISRAYYAAFHVAKERAESVGLGIADTDGRGSHVACWTSYKNSAQRRDRQLGARGDELRVIRNRADYEDEFPGASERASQAVEEARRLINGLREP
jgi:uncharacterized protein (UPF0332 family)